MLEGLSALIFGVAAAFFFSWPIALCGLGICPFLMIAAAASAKQDNKQFLNIEDDEAEEKGADELIVGDSILNYKVVQSFGNDQVLLDEYNERVDAKIKGETEDGRSAGFTWGLSQGI